MISHVVLMKPRSDLAVADGTAFLAAFERAVREIDTVRAVYVGRRVRHGAGYEATSPDIEFIAIINFDNLEALQAYLRHPAHQELGTRFGQVMSLAMVYDCEVGEFEQLESFFLRREIK